MSINFSHFDQSAVIILKILASNFPIPTEIGFNDLFPEEETSVEKRTSHLGTLAFLRHEGFIAHETGSASSFILTAKGLTLFNEDTIEHLKMLLNE